MKTLPWSNNKRILVPVDFSACSGQALDYALTLARPGETHLVLLHVIELYPIDYLFGLNTDPEQSRKLVLQAQRELDQWTRLCAEAGLPEVQAIVRLGKPFKEILKAAQEFGVQLVVMGTHGYTGLQRVEFGSTAEHVVRLAPCPVLVIRTPEEPFVWNEPRGREPLTQPAA